MKYFSLFALALSLLLASCGGESSGTSTHTAKVLNASTARDIHALLEDMTMEVSRTDARMPEVIHALNQIYVKSTEENTAAIEELMNAEMVMFQEKMHFDTERTQMPDKLLTAAADAVSREELLTSVNVLVRDLKSSATRYQDAYREMLMVAQGIDSENPMLSEMLNEMGGNPEGQEGTVPTPAH